jgi:hypothetical protein
MLARGACGDSRNTEEINVVHEDNSSPEKENNEVVALCQEADTLYYNALYGMLPCDFDKYLVGKIKEYKAKALETEIKKRKDAKLENATVIISYEILDFYAIDENFYYVQMAAVRTYSFGGEESSTVEFIVLNNEGKLLIADWYDARIDSIDTVFIEEGISRKLPIKWEDEEWVNQLNKKMD